MPQTTGSPTPSCRLPWALVPLLAAALAATPSLLLADSSVQTWNAIAVQTSVAAGRTQGVTVLEVAIVSAAVYDAVNAIDGGSHTPYASLPDVSPGASPDAAVAQAAHDVLAWLYPDQAASLDASLATSLAAVTDDAALQAGTAVGAAAAQALIDLRMNDGRFAPVTFPGGNEPGQWRPTPPAFAPAATPWVAVMTPFTLESPAQFRPGPPPQLTDEEYTEAFDEVKRLGAAVGSDRTAAQTQQALFWTENTAVQLNRYLRDLAADRQLTLPNEARLFALADLALADGLIGVFDAKYAYGFWRPVTAIPLADTDANPDTSPDASWLPLVATPNHPEYPSAHATITTSLTTALAAFFGSDHIRSTVSSTVAGAGGPRQFTSFSAISLDVQDARILAGFHFRFSTDAGQMLGSNIGRRLARHVLTPVSREEDDEDDDDEDLAGQH